MATKTLMTKKSGMDGGEGNMVVGEICPVNDFEWGVPEEFSGVAGEAVRWL
jgi:hypothetical protein